MPCLSFSRRWLPSVMTALILTASVSALGASFPDAEIPMPGRDLFNEGLAAHPDDRRLLKGLSLVEQRLGQTDAALTL
ncbi:MAG: hypothetical protein ACK5II_02570, partial [Paracoccus sp. (in: a-proteobacteria)]